MYIPKRYGESKVNKCPFCGKDAFTLNSQKVPTCKVHKDTLLENVKCLCGNWLDMREGKFGVFFTCINCGAMNIKKVLEIATMTKEACSAKHSPNKSVLNEVKRTDLTKKEITLRSDELDFM